ncbi:MAG: tetratricopeptide repeat protein [Oligoflexia bacterium]|nr:tetratricopeptide repeat protein [Oligoflexia bacterium]
MKKINLPFLLSLFFFLLNLSSSLGAPGASGAPSRDITKVLELYKKGTYATAVNELDEILGKGQSKANIKIHDKVEKEFFATSFYIRGLCYSKSQDFDKAILDFKAALKLGNVSKDIHYELGQAYYASQDMEKARKSFRASARGNYMMESSLYYLGYISQTLEQYSLALRYYQKVDDKMAKDIYQASNFQIAEIMLLQTEQIKDQIKDRIKEEVIPQFEMARNIDTKSAVAAEISKRINEIKDKHDLHENKMLNGRTLSTKSYTLSFKESTMYDSNVISEAEQPTQKAIFKDTLYLKSDLNAKKRFIFARRYVTNPTMRLTHTYNASHRSSPDIRKNDSYTINPFLDWQIEHKIGSKMATLIADFDYNYMAKDVNKEGTIRFYSRTLTYGVSEKLSIWNIGDTTLKVKRKDYMGNTFDSKSDTTSFSFTQNFAFQNKSLFLLLTNADLTRTPRNIDNSQNVYNLRGDYIIPDFLTNYQLSFGLSLTLTDTMRQRESRGYEQTINPSMGFSRTFANCFEVGFKYDYTKNISKSKVAYQYNKHLVGFEFSVNL